MKKILVTGVSKGIGLEFARQYLGKGFTIFGISRNPGDTTELQTLSERYSDLLFVYSLDVSNVDARQGFYDFLSAKTNHLDVLINNAGVISGNERFCQPFGTLDQDDLCKTMLVNSVSPLMMAELVFPLMKVSSKPVIVNITSDNGSISKKNQHGKYGYSASKAALNMMTKILSIDLKQYGIIVISLHPGWVQTPMTEGEDAPLQPFESVNGMKEVIGSLEIKDSGRFFDWRGREIPW